MTSVYAAMRSGLVLASEEGDEWHTTTALRDHDLECVTTHPERPDRVLVGTFESGLQRSDDGGDTWERVADDVIDEDAVMSLSVHPDDPDLLWAGTEPSRLYRSTDGGETWTQCDGLVDLPSASEWSFPPRPHTHHVRWIEPDPADPERCYVGIEAGALVLVEDGGETFTDRPPGSRRDNHTLATHPAAPERVYSAAGDGFARSTDRGETWSHPQEGLDHRYVWGLGVDPGDPETVIVSAATGARTAHRAERAEAYCYRRQGDTWERLDDTGLPMGDGVTRPIVAGGGDAGELFALSNRGLYRTTDGGDTWDTCPIEWPSRHEDETARGLAVVP